MTINHPKIIGINLFEIIETLYDNKENSMYLKELCPILHREYKDVKVDVMYLDSLEYAKSNFIEDTVNRRVVFLTPKSVSVMGRSTPPKDYDEFIQMFENHGEYICPNPIESYFTNAERPHPSVYILQSKFAGLEPYTTTNALFKSP